MFRILRFLKPVLLQVIFVVVFWGAQAVLSLELPRRVGIITQAVINNPDDKIDIIITNGGIMLFFALIIIGFAIINSLTNSYVATQFAKHVRDAMFKKATKLSLTEFEKIGTSSLITRTTNDVAQVQQLILLGTRVLVMAPVMFVFAMINTFTLNSSLVWVFAISVPLIFLFIGIGFIFASPLFEKIQKKTDQLTLVLRESLTGVRVVRAFHQQDEQAKRFDQANRE
jgi:ATP-binding cassette subfamily B protein